MSIEKRIFGKLPDGSTANIFVLSNPKVTVEITDFGGCVVKLYTPDRNGRLDDIVLGYDSIEGYLKNGFFFGALIGRHANRIEDSRFEINGVEYRLAQNDGKNHLHGGLKGFDKVLWKSEIISGNDGQSLELTYRSVDGEENYPGNLDVKVVYTLTEDNALIIDYFAVSDKDTVVNLTNHSYFNLKGHNSGDILKHQLYINADKFTVINRECVPTGEIREVKNTPMDFTRLTPIGNGISDSDEQIAYGQGYDHNWILKVSGKSPEKAAEVYEPDSGRFMEVYTTKPGIQFYSANFLDGSATGKENTKYGRRNGLCLETQYWPNALKYKHFPSPVLEAGKQYRHTTIYKFSTK